MNLQQQDRFYEMMTRLKANSRAASTTTSTPVVTKVTNGLIISRPARQSEPEIIDLQEYAKSSKYGSVNGINKLKTITDFIRSNGRY